VTAPESASLSLWLDRFVGVSLWVVGDLILDEYVRGPVERISPEAPVPIVRVKENEFRLGGAANVARQVAVLGGKVSVAGIVGEDAEAEQILALCAQAQIDTTAVVRVSGRRTTRKLRVLAGHQQLLRLDWEDTDPAVGAITDRMLSQLQRRPPPSAIVVSDYAKGVVTKQAIDTLASLRIAHNCPLVVDPKHHDFLRYRGATYLTPNVRELEAAAGQRLDAQSALISNARTLTKSVGLEAMLITCGEEGMVVVPAASPETHISGQPRAVYDITGAGDTAVAVFALALAAQAPLVGAARMANAAAGISVEHVGTAAVEAPRLREALCEESSAKVLSSEELGSKAASWRLLGKRVVFTNGCFDLLHAGHLALLRQAAALGDVLVVAINSDASVRRLKGSARPLVPEAERAAVLAALTHVDAVTIFEDDTPLKTLQQLRPQVLVKGEDYQLDEIVGRELVESTGGRVVRVPLVPQRSTTSLVERIAKAGASG
jgi:D-beta-D-heptose 7-phosphate kinase / D-beta-D-heptose 1-phosphate adenosyltransferase